ncbi:EAL domain-containing protein [Azospirillum sp. TSA6c]|uniref:EAL domain-containing protein n=1 Tax=Azospirillum sp. TSA6c TaxID=709813 RepID=UPI00200046F3|nr:EAL domain-containing protein [Azospirillum sp. TSA6c]
MWFTRSRIVGPLGRLVEDARRLARRDLDRPFQGWGRRREAGFRRDELGLLGRSLEDSRTALRDLFAAIEEKTRRLGESERRYAMAAAATNDGLWDWDLESGDFYLSARLRQMLHLPADDGDPGLAALLAHVHPDDRLTGFEALVRWRHPDLGPVSPAQFIPIAEETGQILPLGRHVLERAVEQLGRWRRMAGGAALTVNVNLSARQMWDERYVDDMLAFLAGGRADGLKVKVTESMTVADHDQARAILERFHALGVALCMDDFGTSYSSLSHLGSLPFDIMKIDKSFVSALGSDPRQESLLRGIVELAHRIGLEVVAEGVETEEERAVLTRIGCDYAQGCLFARPLSVADAEALLLAAGRP